MISRHGSLYAAEFGWDVSFEWMVAGIAAGIMERFDPAREAAWIAELAGEWLRIMKPGGVAILSGFEAHDVPVVSAAIERAGGRVAGEFGQGEWRMLEVTA